MPLNLERWQQAALHNMDLIRHDLLCVDCRIKKKTQTESQPTAYAASMHKKKKGIGAISASWFADVGRSSSLRGVRWGHSRFLMMSEFIIVAGSSLSLPHSATCRLQFKSENQSNHQVSLIMVVVHLRQQNIAECSRPETIVVDSGKFYFPFRH